MVVQHARMATTTTKTTTKNRQREDSVEHDPQRACQTCRDDHSAHRQDHGEPTLRVEHDQPQVSQPFRAKQV